MMAIKKGDEILYRGTRYTVASVTRSAVDAENDAVAAQRAKGKSEVKKLRSKGDFEAAAKVKIPGRATFGCRKKLLEYSDEHDAWIVPGQEE